MIPALVYAMAFTNASVLETEPGCGPISLQYALRGVGRDVDIWEVHSAVYRPDGKSSLRDLALYANRSGVSTSYVSGQALARIPEKAFVVTHIPRGSGHFIVVRKLTNGQFEVFDPVDSSRAVLNELRLQSLQPTLGLIVTKGTAHGAGASYAGLVVCFWMSIIQLLCFLLWLSLRFSRKVRT
ncbi:MAG: hypothetical protein KDA66_11950 [Planctomycetaceae bacterium]|nr:hypothetical protein [Planctomycetaceae bacterium]MCB9954036.1 hypothetical protein [Planctomycetaceae bacterium]